MHLFMNFAEAAASVPDPMVLAGHILAAVFVRRPAWAYGAGASWGMGLWLLGLLLDRDAGWTGAILSAQLLGSLSANLVSMWVVLTIVGAVREVRSRRATRTPPDRAP